MSLRLEQLLGNTWFVPGETNVGVYRLNEREVCLIDSGPYEDYARALLTLLSERGWTVHSILCTHAHPDHIGGNRLIQQETGCLVFASALERELALYPQFMPSIFFGGYPSAMMQSPYFMAPVCDTLPLDDPRFPAMLQTIPLPGHTFEQIGVRTPDGVLFSADAFAGEEMLERFHITFLYDVAASLRTLEFLAEQDAPLCVPSHAPVVRELAPLCEKNIAMIREIERVILSLLAQPLSFDELLSRLFERYHTPVNLVQYTIVGHTVRCYLAHLLNAGQIEPTAVGHALKWRARA